MDRARQGEICRALSKQLLLDKGIHLAGLSRGMGNEAKKLNRIEPGLNATKEELRELYLLVAKELLEKEQTACSEPETEEENS